MLAAPALPQVLDRPWIARHLRHAGTMCLIDAVTSWDAGVVHCRTRTHERADNPLRADNRLGAMCGIEYGAQAAAAHGAILACLEAGQGGGAPVAGYLAALREVESAVERLDDLPRELAIVATRIASLPGGAAYGYAIRHGSATVQSGRLTLRFLAPTGGLPGGEA